MYEKMTAREIVLQALIWGEEGVNEMINGLHENDPYLADLISLRKHMRAYRKRRFGKLPDPFKDAKLINVHDLSKKK